MTLHPRDSRAPRWCLATGLLLAPLPLLAQVPADTAIRLPEVTVTVTREEAAAARLPFATAVVGGDEIRRGRPTLGLDESLAGVPGVYVSNRYNYSLDQRFSIRGFGSRANFGLRGVVVLLDGVPQTLPDGQSQLTNVELGQLDRIEVLRGAASALYGNGSGGVLSLRTRPPGTGPLAAARVEGGSFGMRKWVAEGSGQVGALTGDLTVSRLTIDGFRQHSAADLRDLSAALGWLISGTTSATVHLRLADDPRADNPGALTPAEYARRPDSAAAFNILRDAGKAVTQQQADVTLRHFDTAGGEYSATVYGLHRGTDNPLATGTFVQIGRHAGGVRLDAARPLGSGERAPRIAFGLDLQAMRDDRANFVAAGGRPTDTLQLDQRETVSQLGPSAQLRWSPLAPLTLTAGGRWDRVAFRVQDHFLADGSDDSGSRTMSAWSGLVGASWRVGDALIPYANVSTGFETPTTTELANRPDRAGGFNTDLGPQRSTSIEVGARGDVARRLGWSLSVFRIRVRDAIVQFSEVGGRAYFTNAGHTRNDGAELGITLRAMHGLTLLGAYTFADYRFTDYTIRNAGRVDTLDGRRLPGVPRHFTRLGVRAGPVRGLTLDVDQTLSSSLFANDANTIVVDNWGAGVTSVRMAWDGVVGAARLTPFLGVDNLTDRRYVGSVTINGAGGRVLEPAAGRSVYLGASMGYR